MNEHEQTTAERAKAQSEKLAAEQKAAAEQRSAQFASAARPDRDHLNAESKVAAKEEQKRGFQMTADEHATFRANETKLNPDAIAAGWFGTNRELWEMERRSSIASARSSGEVLAENVLKDFVIFDGKPATVYIDGVAVIVVNASVGAQIKRQESQFPTQAALYEWKIAVDGQAHESSRALTMEELVPVVAGFIHRLPHVAPDAAPKTHWSTQGKQAEAARVGAVRTDGPHLESRK